MIVVTLTQFVIFAGDAWHVRHVTHVPGLDRHLQSIPRQQQLIFANVLALTLFITTTFCLATRRRGREVDQAMTAHMTGPEFHRHYTELHRRGAARHSARQYVGRVLSREVVER